MCVAAYAPTSDAAVVAIIKGAAQKIKAKELCRICGALSKSERTCEGPAKPYG